MLDQILIAGQRWWMERLYRTAERSGRIRARPKHLLTGERGEREALFYLRKEGYTVVARRWTSPKVRGDVDLIAWERDRLCFIEVKTRSERDVLNPAETAVDRDKQKRLKNLATAYLRVFPEKERRNIFIRFDIVSVYLEGAGPVFEHFHAAF